MSSRRRSRTSSDIAPDLRNLLLELGPLIDASEDGFPAAEQTLEDLRPLVAQLDPATGQLDAGGRVHRAATSAS